MSVGRTRRGCGRGCAAPGAHPLWLFMVSMVPSGWFPSTGTIPFITLRLFQTLVGEPSVGSVV